MPARGKFARSVLSTGTVGSLGSAFLLAIAARAEGKASLQPINATSHWLNGDRAGDVVGFDARHTLVGYGTHLAATIFWASLMEWWLVRRGADKPASIVGAAFAISAVAVPADYLATPKRFTPGWELVLSKRGMTAGYVGMAAGMAAASLAFQARRGRA